MPIASDHIPQLGQGQGLERITSAGAETGFSLLTLGTYCADHLRWCGDGRTTS